MKFLIDKSLKDLERKKVLYPDLIFGQLLTPLTRYKNAGYPYAIDNGAYSGFRAKEFQALLKREKPNRDQCLFVAMPDIVANGRRTLEIWKHRNEFATGWPLALVVQDGMEDLEIPWRDMRAVFIGGGDPWKDSSAAIDIVKTAKTLGMHVHVGRVNTPKRFKLFESVGADTCDGSGIAMYDHMLDKLAESLKDEPERSLFD